jgi:hypothetical protein
MTFTTKKLAGFLTSGRVAAAALAVLSCAAPARNAVGQPLRSQAGAYEVEVLVGGVSAPSFFHAGETYVMGQMGERYTLRVWNRSGRRIEAVVSVDGRDVVDGRPADVRKRGYLVPAWGFVDIDGWRLSQRQAAAFRFTSVADSYAGRMGSARNVGVIGVAVFPERVYYQPRPRPIYPEPYSMGERDAPARNKGWDGDEERSYGPRAEAESQPAPAPASPSAGKSSAAPSESRAADSAAEGAIADARKSPSRRPGLGTEFGETMTSHIREVSFVRASASSPSLMLGVRYNDRAGLLAMGIDVDGYYGAYDDSGLRRTAEPFPVSHRPYASPPPGWRR